MSLDNGSPSAAAAFHNSELGQKSADQRIQCGIYRAGVITHIKMEQECTTILDFGLWDLTFPFGACSIGLSENGVRLNSLVYHDFDYKKCQKRRCTYVYPILRHTQVWLYIYTHYIPILSQYVLVKSPFWLVKITTHRLHALPNHSPWSCGPCSAVIQLRVSDHDFVPSHIESAHLAAIPLTTTRDLHITYTVINVNHCQSQINDNLSATLGGYHFGGQFSLFIPCNPLYPSTSL